MTDQPPAYETVEQLLERTRTLFGLADDRLIKAQLEHRPEDRRLALSEAAQIATIAAAGARVAHGYLTAEHLNMLREVEERVEQRAEGFQAAMRTISDEDGRPPYVPPTLAGPYDPNRTHGR